MLTNKYLIVRRDGTAPAWNSLGFVLGPRDPFAAAAMMAYVEAVTKAMEEAKKKRTRSGDDLVTAESEALKNYAQSVLELASQHEAYQAAHGVSDPVAHPWRQEADDVIAALRGETSVVCVFPDKDNTKTTKPEG
jgi:hypothetical protein